jgi:hypothetical protein
VPRTEKTVPTQQSRAGNACVVGAYVLVKEVTGETRPPAERREVSSVAPPPTFARQKTLS